MEKKNFNQDFQLNEIRMYGYYTLIVLAILLTMRISTCLFIATYN